MKNTSNHFLILALAIVVMSSSGVLGTYISLNPPVTIWIRCIIGSIFLFIIQKLTGGKIAIGFGRDFKIVSLSSVFLSLHWITYFYALTVSSIAISMLSLFTYPVMTAILEPFFTKKKFEVVEIVLALIALSGVYFLLPEFDLNNDATLGAAFGILSALLYSLRNILLGMTVSNHSGMTIMLFQLMVISLILWPVLFVFDIGFTVSTIGKEWEAILILAIVTTAIAHTLFVQTFKYFSITTVSIISNLTPVCGITLGYIFLDQIPEYRVFIGGTIILFSAMVESIRTFKNK